MGSKKKKSKFGLVGVFLLLLAGLVIGYSMYQIYGIVSEDYANEETINEMQQFVSLAEDGTTVTSVVYNPLEPKKGITEELASGLDIDFAGLRAVNPDVIGWIVVPNTDISYPILQGTDNDYYLKHGPDKADNRAGSIFMDCNCDADFNDRNTIIYGHRMNSGSMFAQLHKFNEEEGFLERTPVIYIYLCDGSRRSYKIFSIHEVDAVSDAPAYQIGFNNNDEFMSWEQKMSSESLRTTQEVCGCSDESITLSTCTHDDASKRFVVQAHRVNEEKYPSVVEDTQELPVTSLPAESANEVPDNNPVVTVIDYGEPAEVVTSEVVYQEIVYVQ